MRTTLHLVTAFCLLVGPSRVWAQSPGTAGRVKTLDGDAVVVRGGVTVPLTLGAGVFESDRIRTGTNGSVGLTLRDGTRVSIGPRSEVGLGSFRYAPAEGQLALALDFVKGVAVYASGKIAKLAPDAVRLKTPGAIVGVRGTTVAVQVD